MQSSFWICFSAVILASIFAGISQKLATRNKDGKIKLNKLFWFLSLGVLVFMMAFRAIGVAADDQAYVTIFDNVKALGPIKYFLTSSIEPGFLLLNYIVSVFTDNYFVLSFVVTVIAMWFFYKALEYEADNINLFLGVFLFGSTMYLYFFGITRLFIAAAIIAYGYRYIFTKKTGKYILCVLIASMFHYSAFFMIFFIYFTTEKESKPRSFKNVVLLMFILMPFVIYFLTNVVFPNMGYRYSQYTIKSEIQFDLSKLDKVPFLALALIFQGNIMKFNKNIRIYNILYALTVVISIYASFIDLGRIQWYMTLPICIILPSIARALKHQKKELCYLFTPLILLYGFIYASRIVSGTIITEYKNIFF